MCALTVILQKLLEEFHTVKAVLNPIKGEERLLILSSISEDLDEFAMKLPGEMQLPIHNGSLGVSGVRESLSGSTFCISKREDQHSSFRQDLCRLPILVYVSPWSDYPYCSTQTCQKFSVWLCCVQVRRSQLRSYISFRPLPWLISNRTGYHVSRRPLLLQFGIKPPSVSYPAERTYIQHLPPLNPFPDTWFHIQNAATLLIRSSRQATFEPTLRSVSFEALHELVKQVQRGWRHRWYVAQQAKKALKDLFEALRGEWEEAVIHLRVMEEGEELSRGELGGGPV